MPKPNRVESVSLTVRLDSGDVYTLVERTPPPFGDNPAFLNKQVRSALMMFQIRAEALLPAEHGDQHS